MLVMHLSEADDVCVQQRAVVQQLPLHIHIDLQTPLRHETEQ